jgi:hypothetical protein
MKKKILIFAAFVVFSATAAFAGTHDISRPVQVAFNRNFANATNISWENNSTYYTASFQIAGRSYSALFSTDAEMIAVSRNILSTELPADLETLLRNNFSDSWISNLVKYDIGDQPKYYATIENGSQKTILESIGQETWSVLKETAK